MESTEGPVRYRIITKVTSVEEKFETKVEKSGTEWIKRDVSKGWYILFEGSHECLYLGVYKPEIYKGDNVLISIQKMDQAQCLPLISTNPTTTPSS